MTDAEPDVPPHRDWSASGGPDLFTLRAWLSVERAAGQMPGLDDAVNFLQDRVAHIFGSTVFTRSSDFIERRGLDHDGLVDDETALRALLDHLLAGQDAPDLPEEDYVWRAHEPRRFRARWRSAVRNRRRTAELARALPRRRRVAGRRSREGE